MSWDSDELPVSGCRGPGPNGDSCERPLWGHGELCQTHTKQRQRTGELTPIRENTTPRERLLELIYQLSECSDDDAEYERLSRAVDRSALALGWSMRAKAIREGLAHAKARGVRVGRPPKLQPEKTRRVYLRAGSIAAAARRLRVSRAAVRRALGTSRVERKQWPK